MKAAKPAKAKPLNPNGLNIASPPGISEERAMADIALSASASTSSLARQFGKGTFGELHLTDLFEALSDKFDAVARGDFAEPRAMLVGQFYALNAIFTEFARRSALNMGEYIDASERYMRLALKAQAQSRATVEALDRMANGHEQTVRHVHVDNRGGQAVIAETVNTGGQENGKFSKQSDATGAAGESAALPCADALGNGVPIPGRQRETTLQDARRHEPGGS